jgi:hypothetical protein
MNTPPVSLLTQVGTLLALLIALSVSTERVVAIIQNLISFLRTENTDAYLEGVRRALLQVLAVVAGLFTVRLAKEMLPTIPLIGLKGAETQWPVHVLIGLLASGGSGFWTSILGYVNGLKDIQKNLAITTKVQAAANVAAIAAGTTAPVAQAAPAALLVASPAPAVQALPANLPLAVKTKLDKAIQVASNNL